MVNRWRDYCERNWLNDSGDLFSPELKVKRFLDTLAYFLLLGQTDGIETDYKRIMHAKREIPASSCTSEIENMLYGTGQLNGDYAEDEAEQFRTLTEMLDAPAERFERKRVVREKTETRIEKIRKLGIVLGRWIRVDTDGQFGMDGHRYAISDQAIQYQPIETEYGLYYPMDRILYHDGRFLDMNYDEVEVVQID